MALLDDLLASYKRHVSLPLSNNLPFSQRIWFVVYPPEQERRIQLRISDFENCARQAKLNWCRISLESTFAQWLDSIDEGERQQYLGDTELTEDAAIPGFRDFLTKHIANHFSSVPQEEAERTVFALTGLMELYDFLHVSEVIEGLDKRFRGILTVFFPGEREGNTYRFLGVRDGWDYLAIPILADSQP
jgi:Domain of unknown function (DUF1788)